MSDLVKRLRDPSQCVSWAAADRIIAEAADEIERLLDELSVCCELKREYQERLDAAIAKARADERERCAKLCESRIMGDNNREDAEARKCAEAIRQPVDNLPTE
jgi:hypothetical protein